MRGFSIATALVLFIGFFAMPGYAHEDTKKYANCQYCNMDREKFAYSRMLIEYSDGTSAATCSLHCITLELTANLSKVPCRILVGDYHSKKLIDAAIASWVIGGDEPGVMTGRAKWAFGNKAEAEAFIKKSGGKQATFHEALHAAYDDLYQDVLATLERVEKSKTKGWNVCDQ